MSAPETAPAAPPPAAAGGGQASGPSLAKLEDAVGGPKNAALAGAGLLVVGFALYQKHKKATAASTPPDDSSATTDMSSLPDWSGLWEQQLQGQNPVPPPTTTTTAPPPTAPAPPIQGGNPPQGPTAPVPAPPPAAPPKATTPALTTKYTVKSGDNLWNIAAKFLGSGTDDTEIYDDPRNKAVIGSNPNLIKPGQVLYV